MSQFWEDHFRSWAKPPSDSEIQRCENARASVENAIKQSDRLNAHDIRIVSQGSYRNNTNVRQESDVDIGVVCYDTFCYQLPENMDKSTFGLSDASYNYSDFKNDVEQALINYFGVKAVHRGNKAIDVSENTYHTEIDVVPFFEHRRYTTDGKYLSGVELRPDNSNLLRVINWPEQHYENGVRKNNATGRRYKAVVRILKNLRDDMREKGVAVPDTILGFLIECMVWNVSNTKFGTPSYYEDVRNILVSLYNDTKDDTCCNEWGEVSELKYLFRPSQKWTREQANTFILNAGQHVGYF